MQTVLLTGARAPVTLDLARKFHRSGWRVIVAESLPVHLCSKSNAVDKSLPLPSPRFQPDAFIDALTAIVHAENVSLLIPTCEEIFTVAAGYNTLQDVLFTPPPDTLIALHSKFQFIQRATAYGLSVPQTKLIDSPDAIQQSIGKQVVLKPEFSRFATQTIILPEKMPTLDISLMRKWVVQQYISGKQICTYSLAHNGKLTAHSAYCTDFTAGNGSTIAFTPLIHASIQQWVEKFVACENYTGQIAFDFIESHDGQLYAIECNPRATSGIHLFDTQLVHAFTHPDCDLITPNNQHGASIKAAMLLYGLQRAPSFSRWLHTFFRSKDVIFNINDPFPAGSQLELLIYLAKISHKQHISLIEATTYDIEWNGSNVL